MIIDSPYWVKHGDGDGISGLDVSPNGRRLATCGSAPQIVIWNMLPILDERAEQDASVPKILATIQDSSGSVLTVRFSHCGSMLAAGCGGDADSAVLIFKQSSIPATQTLGMGGSKLPNIENWRPVATLRGHSLDVTALSWSPGDEFLASASMDGNVHIWGMNPDGRGRLVHSLEGQHKGWVKGLAFDPIGRYLATQGRNGVKVWDVSCGWALVTHQRRPFERSPDAGFRYKTSWSPDGEVLIAMNGAEAKHLCICSFSRQTWELHEMVGHRGAVLVSAANPRLFYPPVKLLQQRMTEADEQQEGGYAEQQQEQRQGSSTGVGKAPAAVAGEAVAYSDEACTVFAAGSNDKSITLWCSPLPRPLLQVSQIHGGGIVDMAWTPDGYTLIAASLDDRVSVMRFARCELGRAVSDEEFRQMIATEYGPAGAAADGQAAGTAAAAGGAGAADIDTQEDAELAALAGAAAAAVGPDKPERAFPTPPRPAVQPALAAAAPVRPAPAAAGARPAGAAAAGGSALDRRLMPQGNGVTTGTLAQRPAVAQQQLQQVGQKRLHPTSVGANPAAAAAATGSGGALHPAKRAHTGAQPGQQQQRQLQQQAGSRSAAAAGTRVGGGGGWVLPPPGVAPVLEVQVALVTVQRPDAPQQAQQDHCQSVTLLVENRRGQGAGGSGAARAAGGAEVSLHLGGMPGHVFWRDRLQEQVVAAAGNLYFTAAATPSGLLYTWRSKGTPLLPPLALGCPPVSLSAEGPWSLLVVGADGGLLTLDLSKKQREFSGPAPAPNLAPILAASAPGTSLMDAWVTAGSSSSSSGQQQQPQPSIGRTQVAVLSDSSGWLFHPGLGLWVMLKQPAAGPGGQPGPAPLSVVAAVGGSTDAERLRARAGGTPFTPGLQQAVSQGGPDSFATRQAAYWQLTAAELLHDAVGYQRWLGQLVNLLARQRDLERLKELCEDLLGPARWDPSMLPGAAGGRPGCEVCEWTPTLLGLDKRTMLAQLVIPALAQERLPLAKEVNAHLQAANAHTQRAVAAMAAAAAAAQASAAAAAGVGAGMGAPAAAGAVGYPGSLFPDLRLGVRQSVTAAGGGQGLGDAATAPAAGAGTHGLQEHTLHGLESGGQSGGTAAPPRPGVQWQQQTDTGSGVAGLSGARAHNLAVQQQQQPDTMDSHQQQLMVVVANGHTANGVGPGAAPRRLQATPVNAPQQQQQQQELRGTTPGVSGEALGRIPLQEQQQPHSLTPQHTSGKQQQHSADKAAAAAAQS